MGQVEGAVASLLSRAAVPSVVQVEKAVCGVCINTYSFIVYEEKVNFVLCSCDFCFLGKDISERHSE